MHIRESLHYGIYIEHAQSLKLAAHENNKLFFSLNKKSSVDSDNRIKGLGLYRSSLMLYAISIELLLKGIGLYHERNKIKTNEIKTFGEFLEAIYSKRGNKHLYQPILLKYPIKLTNQERELLDTLQQYSKGNTGKFPFPIKENEVVETENKKIRGAGLSLSHIKLINNLFEKQLALIKN